MIPCIFMQRIVRTLHKATKHVLQRQPRRPRIGGSASGSNCCCCAVRTYSGHAGPGPTSSPVLTHHRPQSQDSDAKWPQVDTATATELVDSMLKSTIQLLVGGDDHGTSGQERSSKKNLHVVAFSGGVDSTLATALLQRVVGKTTEFRSRSGDSTDRVLAVLGVSAALSKEQLDQARRVAHELQVEFRTVETLEGTDPTYLANAGQACRACKTHLYSTLESIHRATIPPNTSPVAEPSTTQLYNGTNADDLLDATRVGLLAAQQYNVLSPLQFYTKDQVRVAARHLGLSNWNAAASPCLRSRLALGVQATREHLQTIERAERHVRSVLQRYLSEESNVRVRMLSNNRARIELDERAVGEASRVDWLPQFVAMGFDGVSVRPFRSGSVAGAPLASKPHNSDVGDLQALVS